MGRTPNGFTTGLPLDTAAIIPRCRACGNRPTHSAALNRLASMANAGAGKRFSSAGRHQSSECAVRGLIAMMCLRTDSAVCIGRAVLLRQWQSILARASLLVAEGKPRRGQQGV
eukprot:6462285-Amphidinium_carterae.1